MKITNLYSIFSDFLACKEQTQEQNGKLQKLIWYLRMLIQKKLWWEVSTFDCLLPILAGL